MKSKPLFCKSGMNPFLWNVPRCTYGESYACRAEKAIYLLLNIRPDKWHSWCFKLTLYFETWKKTVQAYLEPQLLEVSYCLEGKLRQVELEARVKSHLHHRDSSVSGQIRIGGCGDVKHDCEDSCLDEAYQLVEFSFSTVDDLKEKIVCFVGHGKSFVHVVFQSCIGGFHVAVQLNTTLSVVLLLTVPTKSPFFHPPTLASFDVLLLTVPTQSSFYTPPTLTSFVLAPLRP